MPEDRYWELTYDEEKKMPILTKGAQKIWGAFPIALFINNLEKKIRNDSWMTNPERMGR